MSRNKIFGAEKRFSTSKTKFDFSGPSGRIFGCRFRCLMQNSMLFLLVVVRGPNSNFWVGSQNFRGDQLFGSQNFVAQKNPNLMVRISPKIVAKSEKFRNLKFRLERPKMESANYGGETFYGREKNYGRHQNGIG